MKYNDMQEISEFDLKVIAVNGFVQGVIEEKDAGWMHSNWRSINNCIHVLCNPYDVNDDSDMYAKGIQKLSAASDFLGSNSFKRINTPSEYSEWIKVLIEDCASKAYLIKCEGHSDGVEFVKYFHPK